MMHNKGQSAAEFLMTYGWAILAAVVVISILAIYFKPTASSEQAYKQGFQDGQDNMSKAIDRAMVNMSLSCIIAIVDNPDYVQISGTGNDEHISTQGDSEYYFVPLNCLSNYTLKPYAGGVE